MALTTLQENLDFLGITYLSFTITSANDVLKLAYDGGTVTSVDTPDGTYSGDNLASAMKTAIDSALSCTSTVTWSSSTYKFTIAVSAGHTIAYTHSASDMGTTVGFDEDHAAALSITSDNAISDPTAIVSTIKSAVEAWVQNIFCRRTFESTAYKELYDGNGLNFILLDNYPIIALNKLSIGTDDVIKITNTNSGAHASVSCNSTTVTLWKDGTTSSLSLTTYDTMTELVDAINAVAGWSSALMNSDYASYPSSILIERFGLQCIDNNWVYLQMPDKGEDDFEVYPNDGRVYTPFQFPKGHRNIYVDYTAGYSTIPDDLKLAVYIIVKSIYQRRNEESFGLASYSVGGLSMSFKDKVPEQALNILNSKYRKYIV